MLFRSLIRSLIVSFAAAAVVLSGALPAPAFFKNSVAPARVLPEHIKRIAVPQFKNRSRQFGAQAPLTLEVADAFLSDGRLDVVSSDRSDVRLEGYILTYRELTSAEGDDRFPIVTQLEMVCDVELWDPYDTDRVAPMARYRVPATVQYVSDARRSVSETRTEALDRLYRQMARNIVRAVIYTQPDELKSIEKRAVEKYRERRDPQKFEPVQTRPRFPQR